MKKLFVMTPLFLWLSLGTVKAQGLVGMWQHGEEQDPDFELIEFTAEGFFHVFTHPLQHVYGTYQVEGQRIHLTLWPNDAGTITDIFTITGNVSAFVAGSSFDMEIDTNEDKPLTYHYAGPHSFTEMDLAYLVQMSHALHRTNIEIIDAMDGSDDYYYKYRQD